MGLNERVVDGDDVNVIVLNSISEDDTTDTTEAVDSDLDWCHVSTKICGLGGIFEEKMQQCKAFNSYDEG